MGANDKISGKGLNTRPSDESIIRSLTTLSRGLQLTIIKRMLSGLPTISKMKLFRQYKGICEAVMKENTQPES